MLPALAFLLVAVPLAALLDRLGYFAAVAELLADRAPRGVPVAALWLVAAATTVVLNLDTTIVLLTPLYVRLARRTGTAPLDLAVIPLLLASLASSVLPVSNLTNLIAVERWQVGTVDVIARTALPSVAAVAAGWAVHRRCHPRRLPPVPTPAVPLDGRALRIGSIVVVGLLVGFVVGPSFGVAPWLVTLVADVVLAIVLREVPWRRVPLATAAGVGLVGVLVSVSVGDSLADALAGLHLTGPGLAVVVGGGAVAANLVNNLPALLAGVGTHGGPTWVGWAWLLGVNVGAVLLPWGALANLLWWRILRVEDVALSLRRYLADVVPVALPALAAAASVLVVEAVLAR